MRPIVLKYDAMMPPAFSAKTSSANGAVTVTWNDPTPVDYVSLATYGNPANEVGYNVYSSTDGGATFTKLNSANLLANSTSYTVTNPAAGAVYKVEAFNAAGSTFTGLASSLSVSVAASGTLAAPASVTLTATLTGGLPSGATIAQIAFYEGANLVGVDPTPNTAPYSYTWTGVTAGTHTITAKVTDSLGGVAVSAPINVVVTGALTASFTTTPASGSIGFCNTIAFNSTSTAATGSITGYSWLIQGINYSTQNVTNITLPIGTYPVTLGVINSNTGEVAQVTQNVVVINNNPIAIPGGPYTVVPGGSVTLAGSGTDTLDACNTAPLTYAWNVDNAGAYDYFTANPTISYTTLKAVLGVGVHTMTLQVTDSNGGVGTATTTINVNFLPATGVTLTADKVSPQIVNTPVVFTAAGSGGSSPYEYRFFDSVNGGPFTVVQNYSTTPTWTLNTSVTGKHQIIVHVRVVGSTANYEQQASIIYSITVAPPPPATGVTLTADKVSPQIVNTPVVFTAAGSGGSGIYEYRFYDSVNGGAFTVVQNYSTTPTWTLNTSVTGKHQIIVHVRVVGSTANYEQQASIIYSITVAPPPPATGVTLTADKVSPQIVNTPVVFTAAGSGGSGSYEYQFFDSVNNGAFTVVQNYSTTPTWTLNSSVTGKHQIIVHVRVVGSTVNYEQQASNIFYLQ